MSLRIPNVPDKDGSLKNITEPEDGDWLILQAGFIQQIASGCAVSAGGGMTVDIAAGEVRFGDGLLTVAAVVGLAVGAADAVNPRFDFVAVDNVGVLSVIAGTVSSNPVFPTRVAQGGPVPDDSVVIATIYIPAGLTVILDAPEANSHITDKRVEIGAPLIAPVPKRPITRYVLPGWYSKTTITAGSGPNRGSLLFIPIYVAQRTAYDRISIQVDTVFGVFFSGLVRLGIYNWLNGLPGSLRLDAGTVSNATTGSKEIVINETLERGWYFLAFVQDEFSQYRGPSPTIENFFYCPVTPYAGANAAGGWREVILVTDGLSPGVITGGLPDPAPAINSHTDFDKAQVNLREA